MRPIFLLYWNALTKSPMDSGMDSSSFMALSAHDADGFSMHNFGSTISLDSELSATSCLNQPNRHKELKCFSVTPVKMWYGVCPRTSYKHYEISLVHRSHRMVKISLRAAHLWRIRAHCSLTGTLPPMSRDQYGGGVHTDLVICVGSCDTAIYHAQLERCTWPKRATGTPWTVLSSEQQQQTCLGSLEALSAPCSRISQCRSRATPKYASDVEKISDFEGKV